MGQLPGPAVSAERIVVVGAGVGGLASAALLASRGREVVVVERADAPGGKLHAHRLGGAAVDAGPTVLTMRWVFDEIFAACGASFGSDVALHPAAVLARHAWDDGARFDLHADAAAATDEVARFAGAAEARRFRAFCERARRIYATLERPYLTSPRGGPAALVRRTGLRRLPDLWRIAPFATLWAALGAYFRDPRLRQLFGRYATYCGSSPFRAPATLMLIAHVEQSGVWLVDGGMHRIAEALAELARRNGAVLRFAAPAAEVVVRDGRAAGVVLADGERIDATAVVVNGDVAALAGGRLGRAVRAAVTPPPRHARSLSAVTWTLVARATGFPLTRHNVFFSPDYEAEFDDLFARRTTPKDPTVYVCAQDRGDDATAPSGPERLLCLVNAPPIGDSHLFDGDDVARVEARTFARLARAGLALERRDDSTIVTTPTDFEGLYPGTGGALYGRVSHGWRASFARPGASTRIPGLYCAGGSVHPGPGLPMAALSGRLAAAAVLAARR